MATTYRHFTLRHAAVAGAILASIVIAILGARLHERYVFTQTVRAHLAAQGWQIQLGTVKQQLLGRMRDISLELGGDVTLTAREVQILHEFGTSPSASVEGAHFSLRGSPDALWKQWNKFSALTQLSIAFVNPTVEYQDRAVGRVSLNDVRIERGKQERLRAASAAFNGSHWNDIALSFSHPMKVVQVEIGDGVLKLAYTPRPGQPAEWGIDLPSQPLGPLLERLGTGPAPSGVQARIAGTASIAVFDDCSTASRGNAQLVLDNWFVPAWPEASVLTGKSGSIGVRMESNGDGSSWRLTRVEVGAALFSLIGTGTLTIAEPIHLVFEVTGSRSCAQLAAHLPRSIYRDSVNGFLEQIHSPRPRRPIAHSATTLAAEQIVELQLHVDLTIGKGGRRRFSWHLSRGCGLDELQGEGTVGGISRSGAGALPHDFQR